MLATLMGVGKGGALVGATIADVMDAGHVASFFAADSANTGDATQATSWDSDDAAFTLSGGGAATLFNAARFGANSLPFVDLGDELSSSEPGLGDLVTGATLQPFSVVCVYRMVDTPNRYLFGWGANTGSSNAAYVALRARDPEHGLLITPDGTGSASNIEPLAGLPLDDAEKCVIVSFAGDGARLRVDTWNYQDGWQTAHLNETFSPGAFTSVTHFMVGGAPDGSASPFAGNGYMPEIHVGSAGLSDEQFTDIRAVISARYDDAIAHQLTTRFDLIDPLTATFGTGSGETNGDTGSIMHPSVVRLQHVGATSTYGMLFGHHDGYYIRRAVSDSLTSGWTIVAAGAVGLDLASLIAANGAYSTAVDEHISSPHVWWDAGDAKYYCAVHVRVTGAAHDTVFAESTDFTNWTFIASGASAVAAVYLRPFLVGSTWYAFEGSDLYKSSDPAGLSAYTRLANYADIAAPGLVGVAAGGLRHTSVHMKGDTAVILSSNKKAYREHIISWTMDTSGSDSAWVMSAPTSLIYVHSNGDGAALPFEEGNGGAIYSTNPERQLRDPHVFIDNDDSATLFYAQAGESGIGALDLTAWLAAV